MQCICLAWSTVALQLIVYEALGLEVFSLMLLQRVQIQVFLVHEIACVLDAIELLWLGSSLTPSCLGGVISTMSLRS